MQNRYLCDVGDFGKFGMLREVLKTELNLGLNWYLYPDESHNNDGKYRTYLEVDKHNLGICDHKLYSFLKGTVLNNPDLELSVDLIEEGDILPKAIFYNQQIEYVSDWRYRKEYRENWFLNSLEVLTDSDVVFCDPDNGFEVRSVEQTSSKSGKYILFEEAEQIYNSGKSLIIYHHGPLWFKKGEMETYIAELCDKIHNQVTDDAKIVCLRWQTTAKRFYFWIIRPEHIDKLQGCVDKLTSNLWGKHFTRII